MVSTAATRQVMTEMQREDPYRIRDHVPDFDAITAETAERSRALLARARVWANCAYGPRPRECMDILLPPRLNQGAPIHMFVHGGYWRSGEKAAYACVAAPVLAAGGVAAIVEYDLMPGTRLDTLVDQVRRAATWLAAQADGLGADARRLTASGHSAGAHLASFLAARGPGEEAAPLTPVAGLLLVSGIYDLTEIPHSFLRHEARMTPEEAAAWSPVTAEALPGPHRILAVGAAETRPFHDQAAALHARLRAGGIVSEVLTVPALNHMNVVLDLADPSRPLGRRLSELIETGRAG